MEGPTHLSKWRVKCEGLRQTSQKIKIFTYLENVQTVVTRRWQSRVYFIST